MAVTRRHCIGIFVSVFLATLTLFPSQTRAAVEQAPPAAEDPLFPVYPAIRPNVDFWITIFTRYDRSRGVVHHTRDLSKVYGVISLDPDRTRTAAKKNRTVKEKALKEWKNALLAASLGKTLSPEKAAKITSLFGTAPSPKALERAAFSLRIQTGLAGQFREGLIRSGALVPEFKIIFASRGLPEDLVYLPCVESSFNVNAYSKFGAAGVWQFTRSTGKLYMDIGYVVDERRDPFIASRAAARLLKRNYGELGEWSLAITAYNHGLNGMKRAKNRHRTYPEIFRNYRSRSFKFASRNFYSEFLAARHVAKNHKTYFGDLKMDRPVSHTRITTSGFLSAGEMAARLNLELDQIRQLNPALRPPVFDGRKYIPKAFELRLPATIPVSAARKTLAGLYREKQKPSRFHRVQRGDTAGSIARIHGVPLGDLILANGLNRRATIYIGQTLRIPVREETLVASAKPAASPVKRQKVEKPANLPKEPPAPTPPAPPAAPEAEMAPEETEAPALASAPPAVEPAPPAPEAPAVLQVVTADLKITRQIQGKNGMTGIIHVAPEETLGHYADWLGIPTQNIRRLNRMPYGRAISIGQEIKLPLPPGTSDDFEEKRYEFHQEILEDFFGAFFISGTETYVVKSGDTLWDLCLNELEVPLWLLEKYNPGLDRHALSLGQKLITPLISPNGAHPSGNS